MPASPSTAVAPRRRHVLVAEDDTRMRQLLAAMLRRAGFEVTEAKNGAELLDCIGNLGATPTRSIDLIISDIRMPMLSGLDVLTEARWDRWDIPVILITAFGDEDTHAEARRLGAAAVFDKPFELDVIRSAALLYARDPQT